MAGTGPNAISGRKLAGALTLIAVLAFPVPYGAVQMVHGRRVRSADAQIAALAAELQRSRPSPNAFLMGPGDRPRAIDDRCRNAAPAPLDRYASAQHLTLSPDPWGNAYIVLAGRGSSSAVLTLSAGPDGILQTPCDPTTVMSPAGDDRGSILPGR